MQAEARLQMARPKDLPLPTVSPGQDLDCLDGMGDGREGPSPLPVQEGSRVRSTSKEVRFKTPSLPVSWSSSTTREGQKRVHGSVERTGERSMGKMPEEVLGRRTMGPMPVHPGARGDGLEDAMEKHMVHELMEQENLREKVCREEKVPHTPPRPTTGGAGPPPVDTPEEEAVEETPLPPLPPFPKLAAEGRWKLLIRGDVDWEGMATGYGFLKMRRRIGYLMA